MTVTKSYMYRKKNSRLIHSAKTKSYEKKILNLMFNLSWNINIPW